MIWGYKGVIAAAGVTAMVAFSTGWTVHGWRVDAKQKKAVERAIEAYKAEAETQMAKQKTTTAAEVARGDRLAADLKSTRAALYDAQMANAALAASRAATTTRIIQDGEKIGDKLQGDYPCIRESWPSGLLEHANAFDYRPGFGDMSGPASDYNRQPAGRTFPRRTGPGYSSPWE